MLKLKKFLYTYKYKRSSRRAVLYGFDLLSVEGPLADETDEKIEKKDRLQAVNASMEWQINAFSDSLISQSLLLFRSSCVLLTKPESALRDLNDVFHYLSLPEILNTNKTHVSYCKQTKSVCLSSML